MADKYFRCPYCEGRGVVNPVTQAIAPPHGHEVVGYFTLSCPTRPGNATFVVDAHGNTEPPIQAPQPAAVDKRPLVDSERPVEQITWLGHHDRLVAEWFNGERRLLDDLYGPDRVPASGAQPEASRPTATPVRERYPTLARWGNDLAEIGKMFGVVVLITAAVVWANWILQIFAWH